MDFTVDAAERSTDNLPYENIKNYHHCSYFHISPANATFDKVPGELNLYIGGLLSLRRNQALEEAKITHVLSIVNIPLLKEHFRGFRHLSIYAGDNEKENLLRYFAETIAFIQEGLSNGGGVLVHCFAGASRSATYVVAYLMHKYKISPTEALKQIRQNRPQVGPNDNFMQQLELYYTMGMPTNVEESPIYQQWLSKRGQPGQPQDVDKILFEDEHVEQNAESEAALARLRCKNCKCTLAFFAPDRPPRNDLFHEESACAHEFYLDPLSWGERDYGGKDADRLKCPNCKVDVGRYDILMGECRCGKELDYVASLAKWKVYESGKEVTLRPTGDGISRDEGGCAYQ